MQPLVQCTHVAKWFIYSSLYLHLSLECIPNAKTRNLKGRILLCWWNVDSVSEHHVALMLIVQPANLMIHIRHLRCQMWRVTSSSLRWGDSLSFSLSTKVTSFIRERNVGMEAPEVEKVYFQHPKCPKCAFFCCIGLVMLMSRPSYSVLVLCCVLV